MYVYTTVSQFIKVSVFKLVVYSYSTRTLVRVLLVCIGHVNYINRSCTSTYRHTEPRVPGILIYSRFSISSLFFYF